MNSGSIPKALRDCENVRDLVVARLEGCLEPAEQVLLDRHLPQCAKCRHELDRLQAMYEKMQSLGACPANLSEAEAERRWATTSALMDWGTPNTEPDGQPGLRLDGPPATAAPPPASVAYTPAPTALVAAPLSMTPARAAPRWHMVWALTLAVAGLLMLGVGIYSLHLSQSGSRVPGSQVAQVPPAPASMPRAADTREPTSSTSMPSVADGREPAVSGAPSAVRSAMPEAHDVPAQEIESAIAHWISQWEHGTADGFVHGCYAPDASIYSNHKNYTREEFYRNELNKIGQPGVTISIGSGAPSIRWKSADTGIVRATFPLVYRRSGGPRGGFTNSGLQILDFRQEDGKWLIVRDEFH